MVATQIHEVTQRNPAVMAEDVKVAFGSSLRVFRKRQGISQEELATRAGLHRTYVCDIERGCRNVSLESVQRLSQALKVSMAALFSFDAASTETAPQNSIQVLRNGDHRECSAADSGKSSSSSLNAHFK